MSPADAPDPARVLRAFGLRGEVTAYDEVGGGWSNRVLRLRTTDGDYAVKELRNAWGEPRWLDWLAEGWRVERAALAAGIAAPEPVPAPDGGCAAHVRRADGSGEAPVRVHRWVAASTVPREPVGHDLARWVGTSLARQHALALAPLDPGLYAGRTGLTTDAVWPELVARSRAASAPWADALDAGAGLARRASELLVDDGAPTVLAHGDVDQKNLLVAPDGPLLVDWDVVLPVVPAQDVVHAAVTMACWRAPAAARGVLRGYEEGGGERVDPEPRHLGPALASRLGWIRFSVDRALDAAASGGGAPELDVDALLSDLDARLRVADDVSRWFRRDAA